MASKKTPTTAHGRQSQLLMGDGRVRPTADWLLTDKKKKKSKEDLF